MLEDVRVHEVEGSRLTADDATLHELLVSHAYSGDRSMPDAIQSCPIADAIRYLGGRVERADIFACLRRLKTTTVSYGATGGRRFTNVSLIEWWSETSNDEDTIRFTLPAPLRELLGRQPRYAYLELAALPAMTSKYSLRLYKRLVLELCRKKWAPGGDNVIVLSPSPDQFAGWIGFPVDAGGKVRAGKLRERVLDKLEQDFADVRAFRLEVRPRSGAGRGAPLVAIELEITLMPPSLHVIPMFFNPADDLVRRGNADIAKYRIQSRTIRRAHKVFGRQLLLQARDLADLWQVALNEALSGVAVTEGFATGTVRGERLLQAVESRGADWTAWALYSDEAVAPDLTRFRSREFRAYMQTERVADEARIERLGDKAPRGLRKRQEPGANVGATQAAQPAQPASASDVVIDDSSQLTFEDCAAVVLTIDPAYTSLAVDDIGTHISKWQWTGTRQVQVILRYGPYGKGEWKVGRFPMSEGDLDAILAKFRRELDGSEEYV